MNVADLLRRSARLHASVEAIDDGRRVVTWGELADRSARLAGGLAARGVGVGDRVAILAKNRVEYAELYFAAAWLGAVAVALNWRLRTGELAAQLADAEARLLVAEPELARLVEPALDGLPALAHALVLGATPGDSAGAGDARWEPAEPLWAHEPHPPRAVAPAGVFAQLYTSGTTGAAKGAMLTHHNATMLTQSWLLDMPLRPRADRFLQVTPLFHVGGLLMLLSVAATGARLLLLPEFLPGPAAAALAERDVSHALFVPSMVQWILQEPNVEDLAFPKLRTLVYGASPMPVAVLERALALFRCGFLQGYGLTETMGVLTTLRPEDHVFTGAPPARLASAGREVLCCRVRVVDPELRDVAPGEVGEIVAKGDNVSPGYWRNPEATAEALRGGWFHTGDLATVDEEGYVTIVDRLKDMILVGGENVVPREVEEVLFTHPAVADAAVIGIPHEVWGEEVLAVVVPKPGAAASDRELVQHCRRALARFKCPTKVELRAEIPRNAAGKVQKRVLRDPYWAGRDRRV